MLSGVLSIFLDKWKAPENQTLSDQFFLVQITDRVTPLNWFLLFMKSAIKSSLMFSYHICSNEIFSIFLFYWNCQLNFFLFIRNFSFWKYNHIISLFPFPPPSPLLNALALSQIHGFFSFKSCYIYEYIHIFLNTWIQPAQHLAENEHTRMQLVININRSSHNGISWLPMTTWPWHTAE